MRFVYANRFTNLHNNTRGVALSIRALENICKKWCGSSKFHLTRHTFALNLEEVGATTSEIKDELGHKDISTTGAISST